MHLLCVVSWVSSFTSVDVGQARSVWRHSTFSTSFITFFFREPTLSSRTRSEHRQGVKAVLEIARLSHAYSSISTERRNDRCLNGCSPTHSNQTFNTNHPVASLTFQFRLHHSRKNCCGTVQIPALDCLTDLEHLLNSVWLQ